MNDESIPPAPTGTAPVPGVQSDLQYVSIQLDGSTYGGWYRVLPDGQMELLALANMHCERRTENTPVEQARGMLEDFIRRARRKPPAADGPPQTLGDLLYADTSKTRVSEQDWAGLVESIAAAQQAALRELYERAHPIVFTLILRLTHDRATAEALMVDVFHDVWRLASKYDAARGSVLGWIMDQARSKAIDYWGRDWGQRASARERDPQSSWPADVLRPSLGSWDRLAERLGFTETVTSPLHSPVPPEWEEVAPGITCKLLATDAGKDRVSMLVRLSPGTDYPPHSHAGVEELHLLQGVLCIDDRKLSPGDYNRAEAGTADKRVWSETGCMCVLMTSTRDAIG